MVKWAGSIPALATKKQKIKKMKMAALLLFSVIIDKIKNKFRVFKIRVKYKWGWLGIIASPFKFPKPIFYAGKKSIGRPYFITKKKIDFQVMGLWWKPKYDQYRHEYSPRIIFTFFDWQIAVFFGNNSTTDMCRWEAWLYYKQTPELMNDMDRLDIVFNQYSATWKSNKESTNYYHYILKNRFKFLLTGEAKTIL